MSAAAVPLTFPLGISGQRVILTARVLDHLAAHRQLKWWQLEAGGQLFARFGAADVEVLKATGPRRSDRRSRWGYVPDAKRESAEIELLHKEGLHYVGDWHTHPQAIPVPSGVDIDSLQQCFRLSKHGLNAFILIVVGRVAAPSGLYVAAIDAQGAYPLAPTFEGTMV